MEFPKLHHFIEVARLEDLPPGKNAVVVVEATNVGLFNVDGAIYAISDLCPHAGGSLGAGTLAGTIVTCPWHGMKFDVTNGCFAGTSYAGVATYPTKVENGKIMVSLLQ